MSRWSKETALTELTSLINEAQSLTQSQRMSAEHTRWLAKTLQFLESIFGTSSIYYLSFKQLQWQQSGSFVIQAWDIQGALDVRHHQAYVRDLGTAKGLLQAAHDELESILSAALSDVMGATSSGLNAQGTAEDASLSRWWSRTACKTRGWGRN